MFKKIKIKKYFYALSIFIFLLQATVCGASLTSKELHIFNKKLTATDLPSIYAVTKEINERGEKHPLFVNGLRKYLKNDTIPFKFFIAETLVKIGDPYGLEYLKALLVKDSTLENDKIAALYSLGNTKAPEAIPTLQTYTHNHDMRLRLAALKGLLQCGVIIDAKELLLLFNEISNSNKLFLMNMLFEYKQKYMPVYTLALESKHSSIAYAAFKYLVKLEDFGGIDTIYSKLSEIKHKNTRLEAELLLAEKNMIKNTSWVEEYSSLNLYGRSLLLDTIHDIKKSYPTTTEILLAQLLKIEKDTYLYRKIENIQNATKETQTRGQK